MAHQSSSPSDADLRWLGEAIAQAHAAAAAGNLPFGAVLVDSDGNVLLRQQNTQVTRRDCTGHAETLLAAAASAALAPALLRSCTLYASAEPCAMCAGAIYWSNIGRLVYAVSERSVCEVLEGGARTVGLDLPCRQVFACGCKTIEVIGPVAALQDEAFAPLKEFVARQRLQAEATPR